MNKAIVVHCLVDYAFATDVWGERATNKLILSFRGFTGLHGLDFALLSYQAIDVQRLEKALTVVPIEYGTTTGSGGGRWRNKCIRLSIVKR